MWSGVYNNSKRSISNFLLHQFIKPHTNFKSLHQIDSWDLTPPSPKPFNPEYFEFKTLSHKPLYYGTKFHLHLASKSLLNNEMFFTSKPPCSFGQQMFSHPTHDIFFLPPSHPHKNLLFKLTNFLAIPSGILKIDEKKRGREYDQAYSPDKRLMFVFPQSKLLVKFGDAWLLCL